ncbi:MAG: DUF1134 domain-containing protein [Erythrobacteraceae bacterium]|nr:DUF1134 domain-containing protein [Erythrobacteraceae bacterium]
MLALAGPAAAQELERFDPDQAFTAQQAEAGSIDGDLIAPEGQPAPAPAPAPAPDPAPSPAFEESFGDYAAAPAVPATSEPAAPQAAPAATPADGTYAEDDLIGAAEGVFGKGAEGVARMIEDLLEKQGKPNAYIVGREAGGAFIVGARYGSGTLHHKIEGTQQVYWTGPSIGFDAGANAANTFVLVYNLYDSEDLFKRFPAGEGQAYFVGGLHASYLRWGDVVLIPIRMGAGLRLGVNAGYMKFSKKQRWLPF